MCSNCAAAAAPKLLYLRYTTCDEMIKIAELKNCGSRHAKGDKKC